MRFDENLITSILDTDLYKLSMGAVIFHNFPNVKVRYEFINRDKTRKFPFGFEEELIRQIELLSFLRLTEKEKEWVNANLPYLRPTFLDWLASFRFNPKEVKVQQSNGELSVMIEGPWYKTIYWEVPLLSLISEIYFRFTKHNKEHDWEKRIIKKAKNLSSSNCHWMEFGTRRRYSFEVQDRVVDIMKDFAGFEGTSNPYLARKYGTPCKGTYGHEVIMALSAKYGVQRADDEWLTYWTDYYGQNLSVALTDTFTTNLFLNNCFLGWIHEIEGLRQDSGDTETWADTKILPVYKKYGAKTQEKTFIFSDKLTDDKYKKLDIKYRKIVKPIGGIGTFLSNDVGASPLEIVIKITAAHFGEGFKPVIKLSDDPNKASGDPHTIKQVLITVGLNEA